MNQMSYGLFLLGCGKNYLKSSLKKKKYFVPFITLKKKISLGKLLKIFIKELIKFHKTHGKLATLTAVYPPGRFGALSIENNQIKKFEEKPKGDGALINGGFFVLSPKVIDRIDGDSSIWEQEPLKGLAKDGELMSFKHEGFWQPMDTLRDKLYLEELLEKNKAPWKKWK